MKCLQFGNYLKYMLMNGNTISMIIPRCNNYPINNSVQFILKYKMFKIYNIKSVNIYKYNFICHLVIRKLKIKIIYQKALNILIRMMMNSGI